ncbi:MAG: phosphoribosylaminoimidazolesuccinocarboxamide synthase [Melioribacteraceae bacterium]|nr:phosphoribosylaminoimidazolesuccinocarboxamide synthase [Melioribacteraceae bacterium]MCF8352802.1 phosphoribosylaminoimidazolesuccinocarboxamide synthase [Melioribacteraceae bacterium]MCF8393478.1 phosphoribosylaminoimidazolesuccinocarboxamide synthase [Melioribacteraceae bacterium]MCF8417319.1 phosphoribosylaminoimidazolesuccinocarboxamide synthase [Melioribacteraceae bacterium]
MSEKVILETHFPNLKLFKRGKVRDIYDLGEYYLMISTDRISAFDVIMNEGIPYKGKVLTKISKFWFNLVDDIIPNHLVTMNVDDYPPICREYKEELTGRSMLVKKAELIPIECIVRGYISGSGWKDYKKSGQICGIDLPEGMVESEKFEKPIFTPSTKADIGDHDENISPGKAIEIVGEDVYNKIKNAALDIYEKAYNYAYQKGIILADTKMEFGYYNGEIILIDELLSPDSSRFWPLDDYEKGRAQASFDKQYVRDYLISIDFNKQPPAPTLPKDVIENTSKKYKDALYQLTGEKIN